MASYKILLADDEAALRFLLTETLADEGYDITEAADGKEAVERLQDVPYDLVILDYMVPEQTGVEVCEWLRSHDNPNRDAPVILLTAKAACVTQYIVKPFSPLQLLDTVEELIQANANE